MHCRHHPFDRRVVQEPPKRHLDAELVTQAGQRLHREQAVAASIEEVLFAGEVGDPQDVAQDSRDALLHG